MLLCNRIGLALSTTNISAGRNSSALAGPPAVCFSNVNMLRQQRTIQSNFSCGVGKESIATSSVIELYTKSRTSEFTSSMLQIKCLAFNQLSCWIRRFTSESRSSSFVNGGEKRILLTKNDDVSEACDGNVRPQTNLLVIFGHDNFFEKIDDVLLHLGRNVYQLRFV